MTYTQSPQSSKVSEEQSTMVAPDAWLSEAAFWCTWIHVGKAEANTQCKLLRVDVHTFVGTLTRHHLICAVAKDYARQYHTHLCMASPPTPWPTDLEVPGTKFGEIVTSMSKDSRVFVGIISLQMIRRRRRFATMGGVSGAKADELERDVRQDKCVLVPSMSGHVERITITTILRLMLPDGRFLVQLGKWDDGKVNARVRLPGVVRERFESSHDAVQRLMSGKLAPFKYGGKVELGISQEEVEIKNSKYYDIKTTYIKTIHTGRYKVSAAQPLRIAAVKMRRVRSQSTLSHWGQRRKPCTSASGLLFSSEVMIHTIENVTYLFAWLSDEEFKSLADTAGEADLQDWLSSVDLEDEETLEVYNNEDMFQNGTVSYPVSHFQWDDKISGERGDDQLVEVCSNDDMVSV